MISFSSPIHALIATTDEGIDYIVGVGAMGLGVMPCVSGAPNGADVLAAFAPKIAQSEKRPVRLIRFAGGVEVAVFNPPGTPE